jgi:hypothetical protein
MSFAVVAPVVEKERIVGVLVKSLPGILRRYRSRFAAVTGETGPTVAAKRFAFKEPLPLERLVRVPSVISTVDCRRRLRRRGDGK